MQAKEMHSSNDDPAWSYPSASPISTLMNTNLLTPPPSLPTIKQQQQEKVERRQRQLSTSSTAQATIASRGSLYIDPRLLPSNGCDYPASRDDQHSSLSTMTMTQPLTAPNGVDQRLHTHTPNLDHRLPMPMNYPDVSSIGEGSNYHRQQRPLAQVRSDGRPRQVHDIVSYCKSTNNPHTVRQRTRKM